MKRVTIKIANSQDSLLFSIPESSIIGNTKETRRKLLTHRNVRSLTRMRTEGPFTRETIDGL